ncbi:hypothetical protein SAMN05192549_1322 [Duganella sacchari]|uniref:Uncharacterized protein n=1 Tax=Duganella sacchari TaxID=551987 RepID=A0A1M7RFL8_9BURK|nr:hypothetical protein SAMN05192549_1322 [Duganella sacchari]
MNAVKHNLISSLTDTTIRSKQYRMIFKKLQSINVGV